MRERASQHLVARLEKTQQHFVSFWTNLDEVETVFSINRKGWRPCGGKGSSSYVRGAIERVFSKLLDTPIESISAEDFGHTANSYIPVRPIKGKSTANGQVSRAISYLSPALDWASNRGKKYEKIGAGRKRKLDIADLRQINDPAKEDPTILGKRNRVLSAQEIKAIYPLLHYPAPEVIRRRNILPKGDFGPIALRFMLLTLARREEVANATWADIDFENGVWIKPLVKNTKGGLRSQRLQHPLAPVPCPFRHGARHGVLPREAGRCF